MKNFRMHLGAAALVASAVLAGCGGRDDGGNNGGSNEDAGCTGVCNSDAGSDGGTTNPEPDGGTTEPDGGTTEPETDGGTTEPDGGTTEQGTCLDPNPVGPGPIAQLKANSGLGQRHTLTGLVVTGVDYVSNQSDAGGYSVQFWAVHPCFPSEGIYVERFGGNGSTNPNIGYVPEVGDVVTVDGLFRTYLPHGYDAPTSRVSYRAVLKDAYKLEGASGDISVTKTGKTTPPADIVAPEGFGNAVGGTVKANPELEGARVHIPGELTITNATPLALKAYPDNPQHGLYYGFEVTGGILVLNQKTYQKCDWRAVAADGGTVTFPNGIRGVWDTYTNVLRVAEGTTEDGGTRYVYKDGIIPGVLEDGGVGAVADYTYVLHAMDCDVDLATEAGTENNAGE